MSEIDAFREQLRGEVEAAKRLVQERQAETGAQYQQLQSRYQRFLDVSRRIQEALRPRVEAFAETLPGITPAVSRREFGPAGRGFHGVFVAFDFERTENCPAKIHLRFGLEAGPAVENLILSYDLDILPVFLEFERHDRLVLPLDPSSVDQAVEWFDRKALTFTKTYVSMFFNPYYQAESEVADVVLGMSFPRMFAKGRCEYQGATYYVFTEESKTSFEQDPTRCVGRPQGA